MMNVEWRRLKTGELDIELIYASIAAVIVSGGLVFRWFFLAGINPVCLCPFKIITTIPCPSCGMTRSLLSFLALDFRNALYFNPLFFIIYAVVTVFMVYALIVLVFRLPRLRLVALTPRAGRLMLGLIIAVTALNWLYLIVMNI